VHAGSVAKRRAFGTTVTRRSTSVLGEREACLGVEIEAVDACVGRALGDVLRGIEHLDDGSALLLLHVHGFLGNGGADVALQLGLRERCGDASDVHGWSIGDLWERHDRMEAECRAGKCEWDSGFPWV
jgi:hypothetical protein